MCTHNFIPPDATRNIWGKELHAIVCTTTKNKIKQRSIHYVIRQVEK